MKPISGKRMCQILARKGWVLDHINGSHHVFDRPGGPRIPVPVHGSKELRLGTQKAIMRQAGLTEADL